MDGHAKTAFKVGGVCVSTYFASYIVRNLLSVFTPEILALGIFDKPQIGSMVSVYCIVYACGQLLNGVIGDYIKAKYMVLIGCLLAGITMMVLPLSTSIVLSCVIYAFTGFGLSMLRGPLVKTISENTTKKYARLCCVMLSFVGFVGPLVCGLLALFMGFKTAFIVVGIIALAIGVIFYLLYTVFEKAGLVVVREKLKEEKSGNVFKNVLSIFKIKNFIIYFFICMIFEIAATSFGAWIPTYITEELGFETGVSGILYSCISFVRALCPFICIFLFKVFKDNDILIMRVFLTFATAVMVALSFMGSHGILNVIVLAISLMGVSCSSACAWSFYIPSLANTGKVSTVNGLLDASGYAAAALANLVISNIVTDIGWQNTILVWAGMVFAGALLTFFAKKNKRDFVNNN